MNKCFDSCFSKLSDSTLKNCDVWFLDYSLLHTFDLSDAEILLTAIEHEKYNQIQSAELKQRYLGTRILIKNLLASVFNCTPDKIQMEYSALGKPALKGNFSQHHFNYSDSHNRGIIALSSVGNVGIDIEHLEIKTDILDTLSIFASSIEKDWVLENDPLPRFYKLWTLKEAYLKCLGTGLLAPLPEMRYSLDKPLGELYTLPEDNTITMYSNQKDDYIFSLVIRHAV